MFGKAAKVKYSISSLIHKVPPLPSRLLAFDDVRRKRALMIIVNIEHISHFSSNSIAEIEQVNLAGWSLNYSVLKKKPHEITTINIFADTDKKNAGINFLARYKIAKSAKINLLEVAAFLKSLIQKNTFFWWNLLVLRKNITVKNKLQLFSNFYGIFRKFST